MAREWQLIFSESKSHLRISVPGGTIIISRMTCRKQIKNQRGNRTSDTHRAFPNSPFKKSRILSGLVNSITTWTPDLFMEGYNLKKLNKPMKSPSITPMSLIITGRGWLKHYPASLFKRSSCAHCIAQLQLEVEVSIMIHDRTRMVSGGRRVLATNSNACCC